MADLTRYWLDAQKSTPSFVSTFDQINDILDAPLPAALRSHSPRLEAAGGGVNRSQTPHRYGAPAAGYHTPRGHHSSVRAASPVVGTTGGGSMTPGGQPRRPIYEELLDKGKLYNQRREALKEKNIIDERNMSSKSAVKRKKSMEEKQKEANKPGGQTREEREHRRLDEKREQKKRFDKLHNESKKREAEDHWIQLKHEKEITAQLASYGFKPKISSKGKKTSARVSLVEQQTNWQRRKDEELERLRRDRIVEEMANVQEGPDISHRSQKIALQMREKEGLAGLTHIDAMLERDRLKKLARYEDVERMKHSETTNPKITLHAATLPRGGSVGDRLYAESFEMEERKALRIRERLTERQETYAPRITPFAQSVQRSRPVEDELMMRHLDALANKDDVIKQQEDRRTEQHVPAINPVSDAIASKLALSARERLYQPKTYLDPNDPAHNPDHLLNHTSHLQQASGFGAQSSYRSASATSNVSNASWVDREKTRQQRLEKDEHKRRERLEILQAEKDRKELAECSFTPRTTNSRRAQSPSISTGMSTGAGDDMYSRTEQWRKHRDQKRIEQKQIKELSATDGCTFHPRLSHGGDAQRVASSSPERRREMSFAKGTEEFLERQEAARRDREEKVRRQTVSTDTWRPGSTIPQEFHLGREFRTHQDHGDQHVRALARPVGPEDHHRIGSPPPPEQYLGQYAKSIPAPAHFSQPPGGLKSHSPDRHHQHAAARGQYQYPQQPSPSHSQRLVPFSVMQHQSQRFQADGGASSQAGGVLSPEVAKQALERY